MWIVRGKKLMNFIRKLKLNGVNEMISIHSGLKKASLAAMMLFSVIWLGGCSEDSVNSPTEDLTDRQAMEQIAVQDEEVTSFNSYYNEGAAISFVLGKVQAGIYPVKVGQKVELVSKDFQSTASGDTAYGTLTLNFKGYLFIAASYDPVVAGDTTAIDTVITKEFTSKVTRNLIYVKNGNGKKGIEKWRVIAMSLPEGGTLMETGVYSGNLQITKMTVLLPGGDTLRITSPQDYYLFRQMPGRKQVPSFNQGQNVKIRLEVRSAYSDTEFVSVTYGWHNRVFVKAKKKFTLVSETADNGFFSRVYECEFPGVLIKGYHHAVVNVFAKQSIYDDQAKVESRTWGMPYKIK